MIRVNTGVGRAVGFLADFLVQNVRTTSAQSCMTGATLVTSSGYLTQPSRSGGRHRKQPPPRRLILRRRLAFGGSAVLLAVLVVSVRAMGKCAPLQPVSLLNARPSTQGAP